MEGIKHPPRAIKERWQNQPCRQKVRVEKTKEKLGLIKNKIRLIFFFLRMTKVKRCKRKSKEKLKNNHKKSDTRLDLDCLFPATAPEKGAC
jgi:hypothetical protein